MDPERWRQIEQLYHSALSREPGERAAFLAEACRADREERSTGSSQHHRLARDVPYDHAALGKIPERDPLGKVGSVEFLFLFAHRCLLLTDETRLAPVNTRKPSVS